jgi:hypothetical protein
MLPLGGARAITPTYLLYQQLDFHQNIPFHPPSLETSENKIHLVLCPLEIAPKSPPP